MTTTFNAIDYFLFLSVLVASALVGVYYVIKERWRAQEATAEDLLMGGREMGVFPVAMSLLASYMSAITVLGIPTEMYMFGVAYWLVAVAGFMTFPVTCFLFLPFFHSLHLSSAYEYLELRFNRPARYLASCLFVVQMLLYMAVVLYAPALALNQVTGFSLWGSILTVGAVVTFYTAWEVTGFSLWGSILTVGAVVTFYTALGGLRAVVWTDTIQTFVVVGGLLGVVIIGSHRLGGLGAVWQAASAGGRTQFFNLDPNPFTRTTFWGVTAGSFVGQMTIYGASQTMLQRYMSIQNVRSSQVALFVSLPATTLLVSLVCLTGLVIYATYRDCDPLLAGDLLSRDQLLPYFVMQTLGDLSGVPGLFVSCIFAAALSSLSSCLNAVSITVLEDLVKPSLSFLTSSRTQTHHHHRSPHPAPSPLTPRTEARLAKALGVINGGLVIALAFLCYFIGNTVLQIMLTSLGAGGGPLLGLFLLGMFFPCVNGTGAVAGLVVSTVVVFWLAVGAVVKQIPQPTLPLSTKGCASPDGSGHYVDILTPASTTTAFNDIIRLYSATPVTSQDDTMLPNIDGVNNNNHHLHHGGGGIPDDVSGIDVIYKLSFLWYPTLAVVVCVMVGVLVSAVTGWTGRGGQVDWRLVYPVHRKLCCLIPPRVRQALGCAALWTYNVGSSAEGFDELLVGGSDTDSGDDDFEEKSEKDEDRGGGGGGGRGGGVGGRGGGGGGGGGVEFEDESETAWDKYAKGRTSAGDRIVRGLDGCGPERTGLRDKRPLLDEGKLNNDFETKL